MMYQAYQAQSDLMRPLRAMARMSTPMLLDPDFLLSRVPALRQTAAACKVMELAEVTHNRPAVRIHRVLVAGEAVPVVEEPVFSPLCDATALRQARRTGAAQGAGRGPTPPLSPADPAATRHRHRHH